MNNSNDTGPKAWDEEGQLWLAQGTKAWESGDRDEAMKIFNRIMDVYPERPEGYNKLGVIYAETGQLDHAEKYFLYALSKEKMHVPSLTNLGNIYLERGQIDEAIKHYTLALQSDPEYPPAHRNLAIAYRRMGRIGQSVAHLKRSQRLETRQLAKDRPLMPMAKLGKKEWFPLGVFVRQWIWVILGIILAIWLLGRGKL
ncbi:tetratricopeptide repeat protein [Sulfobacillus thermosulfidooxidans]|uniref:tetratricopeptide repeat protein n=1 Tax=Sulfobacillus thermosulfidooxidans TaxID=28034 RepID=UPI00096B75D3|nr:tetratricopeptide repeat protein [Sulfobacillus thermosulfidooxidans]OLZ08972.1 hypothetical protein BFX05_01850 [Sulfobacillus thermosulfidooxidans]OLZ14158.1 hypothetical protein BFX06_07620 [Sulfobacillus thermosulfidooxidans]OLZ18901.1 hypothetical protein BFX07_04015 [Sulfobacillus thermosulfidooxidans]